MGLLGKFVRSPKTRLQRLPSGSFTVGRSGRVIAYTLPKNFPVGRMEEIGREVLVFFQGAQQAQIPVKELIVNYPGLKLSARELRGGAIVFLSPQNLFKT